MTKRELGLFHNRLQKPLIALTIIQGTLQPSLLTTIAGQAPVIRFLPESTGTDIDTLPSRCNGRRKPHLWLNFARKILFLQESAARKQRVVQGEANNLMSTTADQIIEAAVASAPESSHHLLSNPELNVFSRLSHSEDSLPPALKKGKGVKRGRGRPPLAKSTWLIKEKYWSKAASKTGFFSGGFQ
ncbi:predicted protein [Arabidopsis lyrata subsp. lyrata]|uniref:Predicted protein n=1 Tax=Arabidopsis lyrata subsp. lyrata TaxID=81972 RepID=D7MCC0_ARALL|nr:predicted protein [Arabidopsis lyrata subsp. lyrata]